MSSESDVHHVTFEKCDTCRGGKLSSDALRLASVRSYSSSGDLVKVGFMYGHMTCPGLRDRPPQTMEAGRQADAFTQRGPLIFLPALS